MAWRSLEEVTILLQSKPWAWLGQEDSLSSLSPGDKESFWGSDVLLATPSVGRVSDVATIDDGPLVRRGMSSHISCQGSWSHGSSPG